MTPKAEQLLEAHLAFELACWTGDDCPRALEELLDQFWNWSQTARLQDLLDADVAVDAVLRWVDDWYLPDTVTVLIGNVIKRLIHLPVNAETALGDVIDDQLIEAGVDLIVELDRLRENLIVSATESPLYSMLIANVLYSGIRDYLTGDGAASKKVPGVGSLLSKGASALNKRVPGLESAIEDRLRKFISGNAEKTIKGSRKFLLDALNEQQIRQLSQRIWDDAKSTQLKMSDLLTDEEIDRLAGFGLAIWQDLRQTEYIQELIREAIYGFYDGYGSESLQVLMEHLGLNRDGMAAEVKRLLPELLQKAESGGLLKAWLKPRLQAFYASETCAEILAG